MYQFVELDPEQVKSEDEYVSKISDAQTRMPFLKDAASAMQFKAGEPKYNGMNEASVPVAISGSINLSFIGTGNTANQPEH